MKTLAAGAPVAGCALPADRREYGRKVSCVYTAMDAPLGRAVGNRLEVEEAWEVLSGGGPADVREVVLELAAALLGLSDLGIDERAGRARAEAALEGGQAAEWFERWVAVQGGRFKPGEFHRLADDHVVAGAPAWCGPSTRARWGGRRRRRARAAAVSTTRSTRRRGVVDAPPGSAVAAGDTLARVYSRAARRAHGRRAAARRRLRDRRRAAGERAPPCSAATPRPAVPPGRRTDARSGRTLARPAPDGAGRPRDPPHVRPRA